MFIQSSYNRLNLYHFPEKFVLEPNEQNASSGLLLELDRYSTEGLTPRITSSPIQPSPAVKIEPVNGLVGVIELVSGPYLVIIKSSASIGTINGAEIFRITRIELIPFKNDLHLSERERKVNQNLMEMLQSVLTSDAFYYSSQTDISHTFQWLSENSTPDLHQQPLLLRVDKQFVWNANLLTLFNTAEFSKFVHPLIHGFIGIRHCNIGKKNFKLAIISRRSVHRAGVRYHMRGADPDGNCANFVETEQIIEFEESHSRRHHICSFVQIRASLPLIWSQKPNLKWQPEPVPRILDEQYNCFRAHLAALFLRYGREALSGIPRNIVLLNLINHYGRENILGLQFRAVVDRINAPNVKYIAFDFHKHCQSLNWDRLSLLKEEMESNIREFGYFYTYLERHNGELVEANAENRLYQNGFVRTNCMDCLDRTNVVQALLAMESLRFQLQHLGIIDKTTSDFDTWPDFVYLFKNLWADNGDDCSKQYAGTGALKTDYTRMGKRTFGGALQDLNNALTRYLKNNFTDGYRQDSINLLLGNYSLDRSNLPDRVDHSMMNFDANGAAIAGVIFSAAMTLLCILISENVSATLFWLVIFVAFTAFIWVNGDDFIDPPVLLPSTPLQVKTMYNKDKEKPIQN